MMVVFKKDQAIRVMMPVKHKDTSGQVCTALGSVAKGYYDANKLRKNQKVGDVLDAYKEDYEFHMERFATNIWKVCFHAKKIETAEDPS